MEIKELNGVLYYSGVGLPDNNVRPEVESVFFYINEETQKKYVWTINRISGVGNWIELGDTLKFIIFDELPEPSEEYSTTVALILNLTSPESEDEYDEYACIYNNELSAWEWEKLNSHVRFWSNYYYDADGDLILSKRESYEIIIHHPEEGHWEKQNTVVWIGDTTGGGTLGEGWTPTTSQCSITTTTSYLKDSYQCAYRTSSSSGYVKFSHEQLALSENDEITFICWHGSNSSARDIYLYIDDNRVATFQQPKSQTASNTFVYTIPADTNIGSIRIQSSGSSGFMTYEVRCTTDVWVVDVPAWDEVVTIPPSLTIGDPNESGVNVNIVGDTLTFNGSKIMLWEKTTDGGYVLDKDVTNVSASGALGVAHGNSTHANGGSSHAEGTSTNADGEGAHAEGLGTFATGNWSHAEGNGTHANAAHSHAEGNGTTASGVFSHAEGTSTNATTEGAHAEGQSTTASGIFSHAEGVGTKAQNISEHAEGSYNTTHRASDTYGNGGNTQHSIGIGAEGNGNSKNAVEVMQNGDFYMIGVGGYQGTDTKVQDPSILTVQEVISGVGIIDDSDESTTSTYSSTKIESIVDGINQIIIDDEKTVALALNDLKINIDRIESECEGAIKSITVNGTYVEADSDHNVELTAGTLTLTDADNKTLGLFTANSTTLIQIPEATSSEYGFVKVDNVLNSTSTNPVENRVITSAISSLVGIRCEVVSELPATGENGVIYFVPNDGSEPNIYDEYIWIDSTSRFELIGTTEVDLSNYVTNDDLNAILLNYVSETDLTNILNNYVTDSEFETLIDDVNIQLSDVDRELSTKQDKLTEGYGIDIIGNTISVESDFVTESELDEKLSHYLTNSDGYVISKSINELYSSKQNKLTEGNNITISNDGVISASVPTVGAGNLNIKINQSGTVSSVSGFNANQDSDEDLIFSAGSNVTLSANGNTITISATGYAASDKRKKDIIGDIDLEKAYSLLEACQTVTYTWKDDESKKQQIGVIAQEIQQFFPEIVNEDEHGMLSVDYSRLTVILMSVIKNNIKEMKLLEERIKLLEEKIR